MPDPTPDPIPGTREYLRERAAALTAQIAKLTAEHHRVNAAIAALNALERAPQAPKIGGPALLREFTTGLPAGTSIDPDAFIPWAVERGWNAPVQPRLAVLRLLTRAAHQGEIIAHGGARYTTLPAVPVNGSEIGDILAR